MGQAAVVTCRSTTHVQVRSTKDRGLEASEDPSDVKRRVYRHPVEKHELQIGRRPPHEEDIRRVRRIVARKCLHRLDQAGLPDPGEGVEHLEIDFGCGRRRWTTRCRG